MKHEDISSGITTNSECRIINDEKWLRKSHVNLGNILIQRIMASVTSNEIKIFIHAKKKSKLNDVRYVTKSNKVIFYSFPFAGHSTRAKMEEREKLANLLRSIRTLR